MSKRLPAKRTKTSSKRSTKASPKQSSTPGIQLDPDAKLKPPRAPLQLTAKKLPSQRQTSLKPLVGPGLSRWPWPYTYKDLCCVKVANTASGRVEMHVLNGQDIFASFRFQSATAIPVERAHEFEFDLAMYDGDGALDLFCLLKGPGTGSGSLEVHVLDGSSGFQTWALQTGTALPEQYVPAFRQFSLGDFNGNGRTDIYGIATQGTSSGMVELHILDGATDYGTFLYQTAIPIPVTEAHNYVFAVAAYEGLLSDLYCIKVNNTASQDVEVSVLAAFGGFQRWAVKDKPTPLPVSPLVGDWVFGAGPYFLGPQGSYDGSDNCLYLLRTKNTNGLTVYATNGSTQLPPQPGNFYSWLLQQVHAPIPDPENFVFRFGAWPPR